MHHYPYMYPSSYGVYPAYHVGSQSRNHHWHHHPNYGHGNPSSPHNNYDYGGQPYVVNINEAAKRNRTFRTAIWTGKHLQVTLMSIGVGEDIGLENHPTTDQFLRIEEGQGIVQMGDHRNHLSFQREVGDDDAIMIPAGKWHNLINTGQRPLKLYSIYAPPEHPYGTIHETKAVAMAAENHH